MIFVRFVLRPSVAQLHVDPDQLCGDLQPLGGRARGVHQEQQRLYDDVLRAVWPRFGAFSRPFRLFFDVFFRGVESRYAKDFLAAMQKTTTKFGDEDQILQGEKCCRSNQHFQAGSAFLEPFQGSLMLFLAV